MRFTRVVNKSRLRPEVKLLFYFVSPFAWNDNPEEIKTILKRHDLDWKFFYKVAWCQGVGELIYFNSVGFEENIFPEEVTALLKSGYYLSIFRNNCFFQELKAVSGCLNNSGVKFIPFKGTIFNNLVYPSDFTRNMQDIDMLIEKEQFVHARDALGTLGYKGAWGAEEPAKEANFLEFFRYDASKDFNFTIDLQWGAEAHFRDANKNGLSDLWKRTRCAQLDGLELECMSPEDMLFNLFFHQRRLGMSFNLRSIFDIACVIKKYEKDIDWGFVIDRAKSNRITSLVFFCLVLANEIFGVFCPLHLLQDMCPGPIRKRIFGYFFARSLSYLGEEKGKEISNPYFAFMSVFFMTA